MRKILNILTTFFGFIAVISFFFVIIFGYYLDSKHQLLYREISYFISPYISGKYITIPLFQLYNLMLIVFSLGLCLRMQNNFAKFGSLFLALSGVAGVFLVRFPMAPPNMPQTTDGLIHIAVAFIMSLSITFGLLLLGKAFEYTTNLMWLTKYSYGIGIILFFATLITGLFAIIRDSSLVGLTEKLPLGAFLFWLFLVASNILYSDKRIKYNSP